MGCYPIHELLNKAHFKKKKKRENGLREKGWRQKTSKEPIEVILVFRLKPLACVVLHPVSSSPPPLGGLLTPQAGFLSVF